MTNDRTAFDATDRAKLGSSDAMVTPLSAAAWSFAGRTGPAGGSLAADEVVRSFHELGIRSFFASPGMSGLAEGLRRLIRAGHRDELTIISPAGVPTPGMVRSFLRRCGKAFETDRIDVFLMGWVQRTWYVRPRVWETMQAMKEEGRVGALGYSIHNRALAARLANELDPRPDALMIRYSAAHRGAEHEIFDRLPEPPPGVIAYTATRWGELLQARPDLGFPQGMTAPECYRFSLAHPAVDTVLCAARSWDELAEDVAAAISGPLPEDRLTEVLRFGDAVHAKPAMRSSRFSFGR
jgi:aryl-alcohol dehydrogenase-like predicted oxidoreductase